MNNFYLVLVLILAPEMDNLDADYNPYKGEALYKSIIIFSVKI